MREHQPPANGWHSWRGYLLGILIEAAYAAVLLTVAAVLAWAVSRR